jgi:uncharacterized protein (DUF362 family)
LEPFLPHVSLQGKSVLIKPNLVEPRPYTSGQTTNPALVEAIILWCQKQKASRVAIGEGPNYFQPKSALKLCFTETGIADVARRQHVPWILFDEGPFRLFKNYSDRTPRVFSLSEHAFCWDHIINVPVPKPHYLTKVSIAMKNVKGFLKREDKPCFHHVGKEGISGSVTALNLLIRPSLNIVDGTAPIHKNNNFLLAGTDIVAVDAVASSLMGCNPQHIRTITLGYDSGLGEKDIAKIEIIGDELKDFHMNIEQPEQYLKRVFPNLSLHAKNACSGCLIPLFASLHQIEQENVHCSQEIHIALGKAEHGKVSSKTIAVGECTKLQLNGTQWLEGCPPSKEEMVEFLREYFR